MTIRESWSRSGMTIDPVASSGPSLVRFATPYLEVETQSISSLERAIRRELAQASHAARRKMRKDGDLVTAGEVVAAG